MTNGIMKLADSYADSAKSELRALELCGSNDVLEASENKREARAALEQAVQAQAAEIERLTTQCNLFKAEAYKAQVEAQTLVDAATKVPLTDDRQPLSKVLSAVREYLPPDGITEKDCLSKIITVIDPWPLPLAPLIALDDELLRLIAHNEDPGDWSDLNFREFWQAGFIAGARIAEMEHNIKGTTP